LAFQRSRVAETVSGAYRENRFFCKEVRGIRNAHSEYVVSKEIWLHPLDDDINDGVAVLLSGDGMGVPYGASIRSGVAPGEITCVFGTGPVGLGMTLFQTYLGARVDSG